MTWNHAGKVVSGVLLLVVAAGCSGSSSAPPSAAAAAVAPETEAASGPRKAPDFTLPDLAGNPVRLADSAGELRLIDFWATWCVPCREEVPMLNELQASYGDKGLRILAISEESAKQIEGFVDEYGVTYTNLVGTAEVFEDYGALGLPTAYLVDGEGRVVDYFLGPKPRKHLERKIRELLEL